MLIISPSHMAYNILSAIPYNTIPMNLSSLNEDFPRVALMPPRDIHFANGEIFDADYANYIFNNDYVFLEFMKIIMNLYFGNNVCLLVSQNEVFDKVTESLLKIIQERYGYNGVIINEPDDIIPLCSPAYEDGEFSIQGLAMLDIDKERYSYIITSINNFTNQGDYNGNI